MQRSHLRFIVAAATIAVGTAVTFTAPAALADPTSGPTTKNETASDTASPGEQSTERGRPQTLVFKIERFIISNGPAR